MSERVAPPPRTAARPAAGRPAPRAAAVALHRSAASQASKWNLTSTKYSASAGSSITGSPVFASIAVSTRSHLRRLLRRDDEPEIEAVLPLVVVRHGVEAVDERRNLFQTLRRDLHRRQRPRAAQLSRVEHRPHAAQRPFVQQAPQPPDDLALRSCPGVSPISQERPRRQGKSALEFVQQPLVLRRPAQPPSLLLVEGG